MTEHFFTKTWLKNVRSLIPVPEYYIYINPGTARVARRGGKTITERERFRGKGEKLKRTVLRRKEGGTSSAMVKARAEAYHQPDRRYPSSKFRYHFIQIYHHQNHLTFELGLNTIITFSKPSA